MLSCSHGCLGTDTQVLGCDLQQFHCIQWLRSRLATFRSFDVTAHKFLVLSYQLDQGVTHCAFKYASSVTLYTQHASTHLQCQVHAEEGFALE